MLGGGVFQFFLRAVNFLRWPPLYQVKQRKSDRRPRLLDSGPKRTKSAPPVVA